MEQLSNEQFDIVIFLTSNWLNIVSGLVGIIGSTFTFISWRSSKTSKKTYKHLFELADRHIDKSLTDKQLLEKKEELDGKISKIKELQSKIQNEIPIEARRAVLRDKLETNIEQIHEVYISLNKAREQLLKLGEISQIPDEIKKTIDSEIQPKYLLKRKKTELRNYLMLVTTTAAISSAILPYPFSRFASWFLLGLFGLPALLLLIRLSWKDWNIYMQETTIPLIKRNITIIGWCLIFLSLVVVVLTEQLHHLFHFDSGYFLVFSILLFLAGVIILITQFAIKLPLHSKIEKVLSKSMVNEIINLLTSRFTGLVSLAGELHVKKCTSLL